MVSVRSGHGSYHSAVCITTANLVPDKRLAIAHCICSLLCLPLFIWAVMAPSTETFPSTLRSIPPPPPLAAAESSNAKYSGMDRFGLDIINQPSTPVCPSANIGQLFLINVSKSRRSWHSWLERQSHDQMFMGSNPAPDKDRRPSIVRGVDRVSDMS